MSTVTVHILKIDEEYASAVYGGQKPFEVRWDDRKFAVGDSIDFVVNGNPGHPLNHKMYNITYVYRGLIGLIPGYVVLGIAPS